MRTYNFFKYHGAGNDFIMFNGFSSDVIAHDIATFSRLCNRHLGIGADGIIVIKPTNNADFEMVYYNADGNLGSFCGNGSRCAVQFASDLGYIQNEATFLAFDGQHHASIKKNEITVSMKNVNGVQQIETGLFLDTGSPHLLVHVAQLNTLNVKKLGNDLRNTTPMGEKGSNINFVEITNSNQLHIRTFERGVEDETLACGTGITAAGLGYIYNNKIYNESSIVIQALGGTLTLKAHQVAEGLFENISLTGPVSKAFEGTIAL